MFLPSCKCGVVFVAVLPSLLGVFVMRLERSNYPRIVGLSMNLGDSRMYLGLPEPLWNSLVRAGITYLGLHETLWVSQWLFQAMYVSL